MGTITTQGAPLDTPEWWRSKRNKSKDDLVLDLREALRGWSNAVAALTSEREASAALAAERDAAWGKGYRQAHADMEEGKAVVLAERDALKSRVTLQQERIKALEEALGMVEWIDMGSVYYPVKVCPWCKTNNHTANGTLPIHLSDCPRQLALKEATP